jgi:hypothetical protein
MGVSPTSSSILPVISPSQKSYTSPSLDTTAIIIIVGTLFAIVLFVFIFYIGNKNYKKNKNKNRNRNINNNQVKRNVYNHGQKIVESHNDEHVFNHGQEIVQPLTPDPVNSYNHGRESIEIANYKELSLQYVQKLEQEIQDLKQIILHNSNQQSTNTMGNN